MVYEKFRKKQAWFMKSFYLKKKKQSVAVSCKFMVLCFLLRTRAITEKISSLHCSYQVTLFRPEIFEFLVRLCRPKKGESKTPSNPRLSKLLPWIQLAETSFLYALKNNLWKESVWNKSEESDIQSALFVYHLQFALNRRSTLCHSVPLTPPSQHCWPRRW